MTVTATRTPGTVQAIVPPATVGPPALLRPLPTTEPPLRPLGEPSPPRPKVPPPPAPSPNPERESSPGPDTGTQLAGRSGATGGHGPRFVGTEQARVFAHRSLLLLLEVIENRRPLKHSASLTTAPVSQVVRSLAEHNHHSAGGARVFAGSSANRPLHPGDDLPARLLAVRLLAAVPNGAGRFAFTPDAIARGGFEVVAIVGTGRRIHVVAGRIQPLGTGWRWTAFLTA